MNSMPSETTSDVPDSLDAPEADINAIGTTEKSFPIWIFIAGGLVLLALLAATFFFIKNKTPFLTTAKKEELPVKIDADPTASAPKLKPADPTPPPPQALPTTPSPLVTPKDTTSKPVATGNGPCPTTLVYGPDKKPVLNSSGIPMTVDCKGVQAPSRASTTPVAIVPTAQGLPSAVSANQSSNENTDRYAGEIILSKQVKPVAAAVMQSTATNYPTLPAPPAGATDIIAQLKALQTGQAIPATTASNPILAAPAGAQNGVINTQGNPNAMLAAGKTERTFAARTLDENTVIPKGTPIDCALTTRLVTDISGFAACQVSRDVYSANGRVLLIERMSILDGEYATVSQAGQRYIHVLWTRLRKPRGVTIDIASPSTDGLGGSGIPATVDNRWAERLGGAYMLSFLKDAVAYETAKNAQTGSSVAGASAYQNTIKTSEDMASKVLSTTIGIKPVLYANQGARVGIYVARDIDFSKLYEIRTR